MKQLLLVKLRQIITSKALLITDVKGAMQTDQAANHISTSLYCGTLQTMIGKPI